MTNELEEGAPNDSLTETVEGRDQLSRAAHREACLAVLQYMALQKAVEKGESNSEISQFKTLLHRLSLRSIEDVDMVILDSTGLVIPASSQTTVLTELFRAHSG